MGPIKLVKRDTGIFYNTTNQRKSCYLVLTINNTSIYSETVKLGDIIGESGGGGNVEGDQDTTN